MVKARKRFGQNFLNDAGIIHAIISAISPQDGQHFLEIGPGYGALTIPILQRMGQLDVVEIDRDIIPKLKRICKEHGELRVHQSDALKFQLATLDVQPIRVIGNLPYNISSPLLFHLLDQLEFIEDMHFMLQAEVVKRMAAEPKSKAFGRLTVMMQYYCQVDHLLDVPPTAFDPMPKVDSAIVRLTPHQQLPHVANDLEQFQKIVTIAFNQRRKTISNSLKEVISVEQLEQLGLKASVRAEELSVADYVAISNSVDIRTI